MTRSTLRWRPFLALATTTALWAGGCGEDSAAATAVGGAASGGGASGGGVPIGGGGGVASGGQGGTGAAAGSGGQAAVAFHADEGFAVTGELEHGGAVSITATGGGFGTRPQPTPWLWDTVARQLLAGDDQQAYAALADGDPVTTDVWTDQTLYQGWDLPAHKFHYTTSRPLRHARASAHYGNYAADESDPKPYSKLGRPAWPSAWGSQDNEAMYLSWWQRVTGPNPGYPQDGDGNGGEDKPLRFGDTNSAGLGEFDITVAGLTANAVGFGNVKSWGSFYNPGGEWHRIEFYLHRTTGIADLWMDGALGIGSSWTVRPSDGGDFEFRPVDQYLYVTPATEGTALDTDSWQNVTVHTLGFDDGGTTQQFAPGRCVEISEIYLDVSRARVELSTAATWVDEPAAIRTSEVQGELVAWSDGQIEIVLNQGAFATLAGLYLWVIDDGGAALRIGRFAS